MKRLCGFFLFCVAIGMLIGLFIPGAVVQTVVILLLLLIGIICLCAEETKIKGMLQKDTIASGISGVHLFAAFLYI